MSILVTAPEDSIVNAPHPGRGHRAHRSSATCCPTWCSAACTRRSPGRVPAEGTSHLWNLKLGAGPRHDRHDRRTAGPSRSRASIPAAPARGRRSTGCRPRPSRRGVRNVPVEITETITPVVVWNKEYRQDSGGAGAAPRRPRPGDGGRASRGRAVRHLRHLRPRRASGARPRRRQAGRQRPAVARLGHGAAGQGLPDHPGRRPAGRRDAGRRRLRRPARSATAPRSRATCGSGWSARSRRRRCTGSTAIEQTCGHFRCRRK